MKDFLHHLFLPKKSNNHRAKVLHHKSLFFLLAVLLVAEVFLIATEKKYEGVLGITANITVEELLTLTNQKRAESGLPPLQMNPELANAAAAKASDMFSKNYWAHVAPDGATPWGFIRSAGYEYIWAGENLARGYTTSSDVVNAWMASPGHKANILSSNYSDIGFAIQTGTLTGDETVLVVQEFGRRNTASSDIAASNTSVQTTSFPTSTPTPSVVIARIRVSATVTPFPPTPTFIPTPTPVVEITPEPSPRLLVAAIQNNPLIDSNSAKRQIVIIVFGILLATLTIDIIFIERNRVVRFFTHNVDHIIFLGIMLLAVVMIGKGSIL